LIFNNSAFKICVCKSRATSSME